MVHLEYNIKLQSRKTSFSLGSFIYGNSFLPAHNSSQIVHPVLKDTVVVVT